MSTNVSLEPYDCSRSQKSFNYVRRMLSLVFFHCKTRRNGKNITVNFEKSRSKISHFRLQKSEKKVPQNPRGTAYRANAVPFYLCCHFVGTTVMFCIAIRKLNIGNDKLLFVSVCMSAAGGWSWAQSRTVLHCQPGHHLWKRSLSSHSPQQGLTARSEMEARHFLDLRKREREGEKTNK